MTENIGKTKFRVQQKPVYQMNDETRNKKAKGPHKIIRNTFALNGKSKSVC